MALLVSDRPPMQETAEMRAPPLGQEGPLEEGTAAHSSVLAWRIPWTQELDATVHGVTKGRTQLKQLSARAHTHTHTRMYRSSRVDFFSPEREPDEQV